MINRKEKENHIRKHGIGIIPGIVFLLLICFPVGPGLLVSRAESRVEWEQIPELVRQGNPTWKAVSSDLTGQKEATLQACEEFRDELYQNVDLIDESLDEIRLYKQELKELPGTQVVEADGTTAAEELKKQEAAERILKEQRRQIVKAVGAVIVPAKDAVRKAEDRLEPQLEGIVLGVRETVIARQQLLLQRDSYASMTKLLSAQAEVAKASHARGMISDTQLEDCLERQSDANRELKALDRSLEKISRSLNRSLGFAAGESVTYGPVPEPEPSFSESIDRNAELEKLYRGNRELKDLEDPKSLGEYGTEKLWKAAISAARAKLAAEWDNAYLDMLTAEDAYTEAQQNLADQKEALRKAGLRYRTGKISRLELLEAESREAEAQAQSGVAALSLRKAQEQYRNTCTPTEW